MPPSCVGVAPGPGTNKWHLDEVFVRINGRLRYLWRAVDQNGTVLDILIQSRRNAKAATKFFRKLLKGLRYVPRVIVTDKLPSYTVAHREIMPSVEHPLEVLEQSGRAVPPAHPSAGARDEAVQIGRAGATVPRRVRRDLAALSATPAPAVGTRVPAGDGRPLRGLARGHRDRTACGRGLSREPRHRVGLTRARTACAAATSR